ncbi:MAG TPA: hypothetical protein VHA52_03725 [Candidatus Babeliaceae bacterium]|nr:hypothetical protein [Candidatus Babeliaceae bacterium]
MVLSDTMTDVLSNVAEKLTVISLLGLFLNYFMKELKKVQKLREADKKESDKRFEEIFNRQFEIEKENVKSITKQNDYNSVLADAIKKLCDKIEEKQN